MMPHDSFVVHEKYCSLLRQRKISSLRFPVPIQSALLVSLWLDANDNKITNQESTKTRRLLQIAIGNLMFIFSLLWSQIHLFYGVNIFLWTKKDHNMSLERHTRKLLFIILGCSMWIKLWIRWYIWLTKEKEKMSVWQICSNLLLPCKQIDNQSSLCRCFLNKCWDHYAYDNCQDTCWANHQKRTLELCMLYILGTPGDQITKGR